MSPKKSKGRPPVLSSEQVDEIERFVTSSLVNRQMTYLELAMGPFQSLGVSEFVIRRELKKRNYTRCVARRKPPLSQRNKIIRKQWAEDHLGWTNEDWEKILWTDETWITDGQHTRAYVTRKVGI